MSDASFRMETKLSHGGEPEPIEGSVSMPVFQSSTFIHHGGGSYHDLRYIRLNNTPNHRALHKKLALLEDAEDALVTASGMAAITTALLALLGSGDHLLVQSGVYGGTHDFLSKDLPGLNIGCDFIDSNRPDTWEAQLKPTTKVLYVETIANPLIQVGELEALAAFAKKHGLISLIDNTFASPINFRPVAWGFDLSLHSATKYLNGHTDIVAGAVIGSHKLVEQVTHKLNHLGGSLDPHTCFLLHRGIKTLAVRVERQNENALRLANFLQQHPKVERVHYPGLENHPDHQRATRLLDGYGGMLAFELTDGGSAAQKLLQRVNIPHVAPSLGGVESLITIPAKTTHVGMSQEERLAVGIADGLVRYSTGIEAVEDLIDDLTQALED